MQFYSRMKYRLILSIGAVLSFVAVVILYATIVTLGRLDKELKSTIKDRALANAKAAARDVSFEMATKVLKEARNKIDEFKRSNPETHSLALLDPNRDLFTSVGAAFDANTALRRHPDLVKGGVVLMEEIVMSVWPIKVENQDKISGYVIYTESMAAYLRARSLGVKLVIIVTIVLLVLALGVVYWIGNRTTAPINRLVETAQRISTGDLTRSRTEATGTLETQRLADSISAMAQAIDGQVKGIKSMTRNISGVSKELASAMNKLASSAVEQAAAVTETASSVGEMERTGKSAESNARQIVEVAEKTADAAIRGRQAVEHTSQAIRNIKEDAQEISARSRALIETIEEVGKIISSVNDIAEQSKILAVNASIEAAKAGEYGAGFAVVAQEVKDLAQQSKEATLRITETLNTITKAIESVVSTAQHGAARTEESVKMIANAGAIVNDLSEAMQDNSSLANIISTSINEQAIGLSQISAAMEQINNSAVENQSISRQMNDEANRMIKTIEELSNLVERWKTTEEEPPTEKAETKTA